MTYAEMKDSGVFWIGKIPSHWHCQRLKYLFAIKKDIAGELGFTVLSITQQGIKPKDMSDRGQFSLDYAKYQLVKPGDFAMNHMDLLTGGVDISKYSGVTSPDYRVFYSKRPDSICADYYKYVFQVCYRQRIFYGLGQGVAGFGRWRLPADMFLNFSLPTPPLQEQIHIAKVLNEQCATIDAIVDEAKASIEEYKRWKASVIYQAVTKGLDPDASMKDSGVDIVGTIPKSWEMVRLRFLCDTMTGNQDTQNAVPDGKYSFYVRSPIVERANTFTFEGESVLMAGDGAGAGKVFHHATGKYAIHQRVYCFYNFRQITPQFFFYYMSNLFSTEIDKGSAKSTVPSVRLPMLLDFRVSLPNIQEQIAICEFLDGRTAQIDSVISEKQSIISELESYKKSLIYEAVTGKRKVG